jgi:hypothetical protein
MDSFVVDSHAIDYRSVFREPEQPWLRVARLRLRSQGTDLHKTETEIGQGIIYFCILVHTSGKTDRVGELDSEDFLFQLRSPSFKEEAYQSA